MIEAILAVLMTVIIGAINLIFIPLCLQVVLGLFGIHLNFFICLAIVALFNFIFRGGK